jgi:hypothetical protein
MDEITIPLKPEDVELLLEVMGQVNCVGKEGAIQLLRILNALENAIKNGANSEEAI